MEDVFRILPGKGQYLRGYRQGELVSKQKFGEVEFFQVPIEDESDHVLFYIIGILHLDAFEKHTYMSCLITDGLNTINAFTCNLLDEHLT